MAAGRTEAHWVDGSAGRQRWDRAAWHDGPVTTTVPIADDVIRLGQLLKLAGLAESGAHARDLLLDGAVTVNGQPEDRRGRQLVPGDEVTVDLPSGPETVLITKE